MGDFFSKIFKLEPKTQAVEQKEPSFRIISLNQLFKQKEQSQVNSLDDTNQEAILPQTLTVEQLGHLTKISLAKALEENQKKGGSNIMLLSCSQTKSKYVTTLLKLIDSFKVQVQNTTHFIQVEIANKMRLIETNNNNFDVLSNLIQKIKSEHTENEHRLSRVVFVFGLAYVLQNKEIVQQLEQFVCDGFDPLVVLITSKFDTTQNYWTSIESIKAHIMILDLQGSDELLMLYVLYKILELDAQDKNSSIEHQKQWHKEFVQIQQPVMDIPSDEDINCDKKMQSFTQLLGYYENCYLKILRHKIWEIIKEPLEVDENYKDYKIMNEKYTDSNNKILQLLTGYCPEQQKQHYIQMENVMQVNKQEEQKIDLYNKIGQVIYFLIQIFCLLIFKQKQNIEPILVMQLEKKGYIFINQCDATNQVLNEIKKILKLKNSEKIKNGSESCVLFYVSGRDEIEFEEFIKVQEKHHLQMKKLIVLNSDYRFEVNFDSKTCTRFDFPCLFQYPNYYLVNKLEHQQTLQKICHILMS